MRLKNTRKFIFDLIFIIVSTLFPIGLSICLIVLAFQQETILSEFVYAASTITVVATICSTSLAKHLINCHREEAKAKITIEKLNKFKQEEKNSIPN